MCIIKPDQAGVVAKYTSASLAAYMRAEFERFKKVIKAGGIKPI